jgi:hypothetical protein
MIVPRELLSTAVLTLAGVLNFEQPPRRNQCTLVQAARSRPRKAPSIHLNPILISFAPKPREATHACSDERSTIDRRVSDLRATIGAGDNRATPLPSRLRRSPVPVSRVRAHEIEDCFEEDGSAARDGIGQHSGRRAYRLLIAGWEFSGKWALNEFSGRCRPGRRMRGRRNERIQAPTLPQVALSTSRSARRAAR